MRVKELDIARGFTVFIMPGVHVLMMYGNNTVKTSLPAMLFSFLAEGPGAPLFMVLMGTSFCFSRHTAWAQVLKRSFLLLLCGYALNFLKFTVLQLTGFMPIAFLNAYHIPAGKAGILQLLLLGDILQFAAIALIILKLILETHCYYFISAPLCLIVTVISPLHLPYVPSFYAADLFIGKNPLIFFPVFPWLAYPLAGVFIAGFIKNQVKDFVALRNIGLILFIGCYIIGKITGISLMANFYRSAPLSTLFHISIVLLWLYFIHLALRKQFLNYFYSFFYRLSKHITSLYVLQWLIVFWCLPLAGYARSGILATLGWMIFLTAVTFSPWRMFKIFKPKTSEHAKAIRII